MIDIKQALRHASDILIQTSTDAKFEAEILLAHVLNRSNAFLYTYPEKIIDRGQYHNYQELLIKRSAGYPIAYLLGQREFWSLPLSVHADTLIPRPETELLVELALELCKDLITASVLDLGTGSGAIALAIAHERTAWHVLACDISKAAIKIAQHNSLKLAISNIDILHSDWFLSISGLKFNIITSNPPYIAANDPHLQQGDLRFEPQIALIGGTDGLRSLTHIIKHACDYMLPGGLLLLEHGSLQKHAVGALLHQYGYNKVHCWQDLQGHDRVSGGWR